MSKSPHPVRLRHRRPCPICGKPSQQRFHPFCSKRCADIDLSRWLGGSYAIPGAVHSGQEKVQNGDDSDE
jgi:hypothetical protein